MQDKKVLIQYLSMLVYYSRIGPSNDILNYGVLISKLFYFY